MSFPGAAPRAKWFSRDRGPLADPARVEAQIEGQIADEFAGHLELLERQLIDSGAAPAHAADLARRRFGDTDRHARECRAIALKEQLMLRKIHLAVTIILALLLFGAIAFSFTAARIARKAEMQARMIAEQSRDAAEQALQRARAAEKAAEQPKPSK